MTQLQQHPRNPYVSLSIYIITCLLYHSPHLQIDEDDFTAFGNISMTKQVGSRSSELREYLRKPVENVKEPMKWWVANHHVYPNLSHMALDYLSIPGM